MPPSVLLSRFKLSSPAVQIALCVAVVASLTALRGIFATTIELRVDEAYYWTWSKEAVISFLDHPPLISWFIRLSWSSIDGAYERTGGPWRPGVHPIWAM